jgi:hypothetical protein
MTKGIELIANERHRQMDEEGWTADHDDDHDDHSLALIAALYATPQALFEVSVTADSGHWVDPWCWDANWDKRPRNAEDELLHAEETPIADRIRCLTKAGALVAAEIDRLLRKAAKA